MKNNIFAILLSAGLGTRLKPLTDFLPKCLMPINGMPLLEIWIRTLNLVGIDDILVNLHYRSEDVLHFLSRNLRYPASAAEQGVEGKVFVYFVVEANGVLSNFKVLRGIGAGCDEEALRVVRLLPPWQAGTLNGVEVRSSYVLPITFILGN